MKIKKFKCLNMMNIQKLLNKNTRYIILLLVLNIFYCQNIFSQDERYVPDADDAAVVTQVFPTQMFAGRQYNVILRFKNTGTSIWTPEYYKVKLISSGNSYESLWNVSEDFLKDKVSPGSIVTFNFHVKAPETPGSYEFKWSMYANGVFFGQATDSDFVTVNGPETAEENTYQSGTNSGSVNNAVFLNQVMTNEMTPKMTYQVSITAQNTGQTTWTTADGYNLSLVDTLLNTDKNDLHYDNIPLPRDVMPGEEITFTFNIDAPAAPGTYRFAWIMKQGETAFGEPTQTYDVNVRKGNQQFKDEELQK